MTALATEAGSTGFGPVEQVMVSTLVGGAALVALHLAAELRRRNVPSSAWVPGPGPATAALAREGIPWQKYDLEGLKGPAVARLLAGVRMVPGLLRGRPRVVHVHNPVVFGLMRPFLRAARRRTVVHVHIAPSQAETDWLLQSPPDHIVTCARYIAADVRSAVESRAMSVPVSSAPNAVDADRFRPGDRAAARAAVGLPTTRFVVLMLANLAPHKGQLTTMRALRLLRARGVDAECWLVGEDRSPDRAFEAELRRLSSELSLDGCVRFLGFRQDAPDLLRAADVFALPSSHEGLPLSVLEAQAAGVPVVASTIPGVREVVDDGRTGFLAPADDPEGYADRFAAIAGDAALRGRVVGEALAYVAREHSWSALEERVFGVYASVAAV